MTLLLAASLGKIASEAGYLLLLLAFVALGGRLFGSSPARRRRTDR